MPYFECGYHYIKVKDKDHQFGKQPIQNVVCPECGYYNQCQNSSQNFFIINEISKTKYKKALEK
jgi:hypothetical protein